MKFIKLTSHYTKAPLRINFDHVEMYERLDVTQASEGSRIYMVDSSGASIPVTETVEQLDELLDVTTPRVRRL